MALIAYIDRHPGGFIGRPTSDGLRSKPVVELEVSDGEPRYAIEEFVIAPNKMQFQAVYGIHGPEPYVYKGAFIRTESGRLEIGTVELRRYHVRPSKTDD